MLYDALTSPLLFAVGVWLVWLLVLASTRAWGGPARQGDGPASTFRVGGPVTAVASPSWVAAMTGAWMLDEASGTRVNAQGATGRNLAEEGGAIANNTTTKMEGTAAGEFVATKRLTTADSTLVALGESGTFTCMMWMRWTGSGGVSYMLNATTNGGGPNGLTFFFSVTQQAYRLSAYSGGSSSGIQTIAPVIVVNQWYHAAVRRTSANKVQIFRNGVQDNQATTVTQGAGAAGPFRISDTSSGWVGEIDEVACTTAALANSALCRICSCGIRGEQCTCNGTAFVSTGRNAANCASCTLPTDCSASAPALFTAAAASWVPSMTATWMLDEASGTRVNAQGTATRDLTPNGSVTNDTTNKMEGTAAASIPFQAYLSSADTALRGLAPPFTCGLWLRPTLNDSYFVQNATGSNGFRLGIISSKVRYKPFTSADLEAPPVLPISG